MQRLFILTTTLIYLAAASPASSEQMTKGQAVAPFTPQIKPGEYVWHPEISPAGPVVIIVSLPEQVLYVYRNGVRMAGSSSISKIVAWLAAGRAPAFSDRFVIGN